MDQNKENDSFFNWLSIIWTKFITKMEELGSQNINLVEQRYGIQESKSLDVEQGQKIRLLPTTAPPRKYTD